MRVRVRMANGDQYTVENMPDTDALEMAGDLEEGTSATMTLTLDGTPDTPPGVVHMMRAHISSLELD